MLLEMAQEGYNGKKITISALFLALGLILPLFTGQIKEIGNMMLPMHLPIFLCAFICGPVYAMVIGFICPILRSFIFGMPPLYPQSIRMAFELATYGFVCGSIYKAIGKKNVISIYISLIISMIAGRIVWAIVTSILLGIDKTSNQVFTLGMFASYAFYNGIVGIILQLVLIPIIVKLMEKYVINE